MSKKGFIQIVPINGRNYYMCVNHMKKINPGILNDLFNINGMFENITMMKQNSQDRCLVRYVAQWDDRVSITLVVEIHLRRYVKTSLIFGCCDDAPQASASFCLNSPFLMTYSLPKYVYVVRIDSKRTNITTLRHYEVHFGNPKSIVSYVLHHNQIVPSNWRCGISEHFNPLESISQCQESMGGTLSGVVV